MPISMQELKEKRDRLKTGEELILDVRTAEEFREGHVPGARNIPFDEVPEHAAELGKFKHVYLYCHSGGRVQWTCQMLAQLGLKNFDGVMEGGMPDWIEAGFPVEK